MHYHSRYLCAVMLFLHISFLHAQTKVADSPLDIGMPIPGMEAYRGKLLILDFWDVSCLPCIAAFPKMQELQDTFGDRIQVLLVTTDSKEKVDKLKERSKIVQQVHLPMVVNDSTLFRRFPFASVPAHVWVGPDGKIQYMTNGQNTTQESVGAYLQGKDPDLPVKREQKDYDFDAPLMLEGGGRQLDRMIYYSSLTTRMPTDFSQSGVLTETDGTKTHVKAINTSILQLYQLAYGESATSVYKNDNRVVLQVKDPSRLRWPKDRALQDEWKEKNVFSYEINVKPAFADRLFPLMKKDLDHLFGISSRVEKQRAACWVLKKTGSSDLLRSTGGEWRYRPNYELGKGAKAEIHNLPMGKLVTLLEEMIYHFGDSALPILDGTTYLENLDIQLNNYPANLKSLRKDLQRYGLDLAPVKRIIDILVLEDAP